MSSVAGNVFMVVAPSGAGKSSLVNALLDQDKSLWLSVSCTTRAPRSGEQNGKDYRFVTHEEFDALRHNDQLLEWAEVHGNYYGTPRKVVSDRIASEWEMQSEKAIEEKLSPLDTKLLNKFTLPGWMGGQTAAELDPEFTAAGYCVPGRSHVAAGSIAMQKARQRMAGLGWGCARTAGGMMGWTRWR